MYTRRNNEAINNVLFPENDRRRKISNLLLEIRRLKMYKDICEETLDKVRERDTNRVARRTFEGSRTTLPPEVLRMLGPYIADRPSQKRRTFKKRKVSKKGIRIAKRSASGKKIFKKNRSRL